MLGVLILWLGWFGFNGGSQLALGSAADAVAMSNILVNTNAGGAKFHIQLLGVVSVGAFAFVASLIVWKVMDLVIGVRVAPEVERLGQDVGELGIETYPEFVLMPEEFGDEGLNDRLTGERGSWPWLNDLVLTTYWSSPGERRSRGSSPR